MTTPLRTVDWYHPDTRFGFRHPSNADVRTNVWGEGAFWHFNTNTRGFRGDDWPAAPAVGKFRVLVLGDSFTFGEAVEYEETFPLVAEKIVREYAEDWEIINLGVIGWGPSNAAAWLETEGRSIAASCLIYGLFTGNDVLDNVNSELYVLRDGDLNYTHLEDHDLLDRRRTAIRTSSLFRYLRTHSQLFNLVLYAKAQLTADEAPVRPTKQTFEEALLLNRALLDRLTAMSRRRFGGFGLLIIPMRSMLSEAAPGDDRYPLWIAKATREDVLAWAANARVPVLDLLEHLPRDVDAVRSLFFERDLHANGKGYREIGRLLAEELPRLCASDNAAKRGGK